MTEKDRKPRSTEEIFEGTKVLEEVRSGEAALKLLRQERAKGRSDADIIRRGFFPEDGE